MSKKYQEVYLYETPLHRWLYQHGGRSMDDYRHDGVGGYVLMWNGRKKILDRIDIPSKILG